VREEEAKEEKREKEKSRGRKGCAGCTRRQTQAQTHTQTQHRHVIIEMIIYDHGEKEEAGREGGRKRERVGARETHVLTLSRN
jgi:hypothetical protein